MCLMLHQTYIMSKALNAPCPGLCLCTCCSLGQGRPVLHPLQVSYSSSQEAPHRSIITQFFDKNSVSAYCVRGSQHPYYV